MAHIHEKIDFTASILVVQDNAVLLHMHKKLHIWLPPGGHIELDEDPNQAAIREAKEETGLDIELVGSTRDHPSKSNSGDLIPPRFLNRHFFKFHFNIIIFNCISFSLNFLSDFAPLLLCIYFKFNSFLTPLMHSLDLAKQEDEKTTIFETRLFAELNKILGLDLKP